MKGKQSMNLNSNFSEFKNYINIDHSSESMNKVDIFDILGGAFFIMTHDSLILLVFIIVVKSSFSVK